MGKGYGGKTWWRAPYRIGHNNDEGLDEVWGDDDNLDDRWGTMKEEGGD